MIYVVGIGPGDTSLTLKGVSDYWAISDHIIGSERQLKVLPPEFENKGYILPKSLKELTDQLVQWNLQGKKVTVLASGDPLLYGIGNYLRKQFPKEIQIIPGISSLQYIFTQINLPMNETYLTSSHGKTPNFDLLVQLNQIAMVTDKVMGPYEISKEFCKRGCKNFTMYIGENLSYGNQKISSYPIDKVPKKKYEMNVVVINDERQ